MTDPQHNPMHHPHEQPSGSDAPPRFGRLLIALSLAVMLITALSFAAEAWYA